uniref:Uncharacterized protein n=1 Tax=Arundo donax TaxID=35708 RepID=A0A0A9CHX2_ARUDO
MEQECSSALLRDIHCGGR